MGIEILDPAGPLVLVKLKYEVPPTASLNLLPNLKEIFAATDSSEVPFAGIGVDSNVSIQDIFAKRKDGFIQGNFSEKVISQDFNEFDKALNLFLTEISSLSIEDRNGWICGLGHGVIKTTPQENVKHFVKKVRSYL